MKKNKEAKKYIRQLKKEFPYIGKDEKLFISSLEKRILLNTNTTYSYNDLVSKCGLPSEIASTYFEENTTYPYHKYQKIKIIIYILITSLLILSIFIILKSISESDYSYINREIIEVQEEN